MLLKQQFYGEFNVFTNSTYVHIITSSVMSSDELWHVDGESGLFIVGCWKICGVGFVS